MSAVWRRWALGLGLPLAVLAWLTLACSETPAPPPTPTPDPRIGEVVTETEDLRSGLSGIESQLESLQGDLDRAAELSEVQQAVEQGIATAIAGLATPVPLEDLVDTIEQSISSTVEDLPTPVPIESVLEQVDERIDAAVLQLPTPVPTIGLDQIDELISSAIAAIPSPTPQPSPTPFSTIPSVQIVPQVSASVTEVVSGNVLLSLEPGVPIAGRDITFTLAGADPWEPVGFELLDPAGQPAEWITEGGVTFTPLPEGPVTKRTLYADSSGRLQWTRLGFEDVEGIWTLRMSFPDRDDADPVSVTYPSIQLQYPTADTESFGVDLRHYRGNVTETFMSARVPTTLGLEIQHLFDSIVKSAQELLGSGSRQLPSIHLLGDQNMLAGVSEALGREVGWEFGFYTTSDSRPGIYMRTDATETHFALSLAHEYVHLLLREITDSSLPAWLNEGLAEYTSFEIDVYKRDQVVRRDFLVSALLTRDAAVQGQLITLTSLESQANWNSEKPQVEVQLQYAQAHMIVRYLAETYGIEKVMDVVHGIGNGQTFRLALLQATGVSYGEMETAYRQWLETWTSDVQVEASRYLEVLTEVMLTDDEISDERRADLNSGLPLSQRVQTKESLVQKAQGSVDRLDGTVPPPQLSDLHEEGIAYLNRVVDWLTLELEYSRTLNDAKRVEANSMIDEINARSISVRRGISRQEYDYPLP